MGLYLVFVGWCLRNSSQHYRIDPSILELYLIYFFITLICTFV